MLTGGGVVTGKAPAKKSEPKKPEPKPTKRAYDPEAKIIVIVKDNPRREGSALHKDFEMMRKVKSVGEYYQKGGRTGILRKCITRKAKLT